MNRYLFPSESIFFMVQLIVGANDLEDLQAPSCVCKCDICDLRKSSGPINPALHLPSRVSGTERSTWSPSNLFDDCQTHTCDKVRCENKRCDGCCACLRLIALSAKSFGLSAIHAPCQSQRYTSVSMSLPAPSRRDPLRCLL